MTITEQIEVSAGAIRSRARALGLALLDRDTAYRLWDEQHRAQPGTVAGLFYLAATDRQMIRVVNRAVDGYHRSNGR